MNPLEWQAPWAVVTGALFAVVMLRANATYWVGRAAAGAVVRHRRVAALMSAPGYRRVVGWIDRWGAPVVSVSFLTVGVQTMVNLAAGATKMRLRHYLPAVTVGCLLWALIYSTVGFIGWRAFAGLYQRSPGLAWTCVVIVVLASAAFVVSRVRASRKAPADEPPAPERSAPERSDC